MAKNKGLSGWHSMKKDELVKALMRAAQKRAKLRAAHANHKTAASQKTTKPSKSMRQTTLLKSHSSHSKVHPAHSNGAKSNGVKVNGAIKHGLSDKHIAEKKHSAEKPGTVQHTENGKSNGKPLHAVARPLPAPPRKTAKQQRIADRIHIVNVQRERLKDLSAAFSLSKAGSKRRVAEKDRLVLMVRDSYWLQAIWTVTRLSVQRAEAALSEHWHTAGPVLRLLEVDGGHTTSTAERVVREIEVHGGVTNWYIDVNNPPHSYRVELGYKAGNGRFFSLCRSNIVHTPAPDSGDVIDGNWTDVAANYERVYALSGGYNDDNNQSGELQELFEERLRRPMGNTKTSQFGSGAERVLNRHRDLEFSVDAEMILYGRTKPDAKVTLGGEPIKLRPDGSFTVRQPLPDKRQVLPVVASSPDGVEQRTIVIAIERNTKVLEPMVRETND